MSEETTQLIVGDAAAAALDDLPRRRRFFGRRKNLPPLTHCENCATPLTGPYCSRCGQHAIDYRRSFGRVVLDVLDSFLNWDSKFFDTIGLLLVRPWKLTIDFVAGKRVRYVHPLRLYLLVSIAFFFGVHELAKRANIHGGRNARSPEAKAKLDEAIEDLPSEVQNEVRAEMQGSSKDKPFVLMQTKGNGGDNAFEKWINQRVKEKIGENGINAQVFFLTLVSNLPAMMLCCIPLFAFVLKVLYLFKRVLYIDHLIYALHIHAFAYLAIMIVGFGSVGVRHVLPALAGVTRAALIVSAVVLVFLSIRRVYRQGWFMTLLKFCFGGLAYLIVLSIALAVTFFATLALP